ncbi:hypothetical protein HCC61_16065 [Streptomyces sp. HNM0575]|uniref:hypothetical protein n=1 Tax=Streptomyces sp. HNM0575 TaxID=2716338 RepID=UPI00145DBB69|nr:hypothetical protein [Streptomyces sp. HNM0575]NLU74178.1 hypothetical protein [Streptomyces sp. HNM0575]
MRDPMTPTAAGAYGTVSPYEATASYGPASPEPSAFTAYSRRRRRLPGILLAVLLAVFGGSMAAAHQVAAGAQRTHGTQAVQLAHGGGQSAVSHQHQEPPQHFHGAIVNPGHAAAQAPLPLLPAVEQDAREPRRGSVLPDAPRLSATQLTHRSPRQGRAPPAGTGI